MATRKLSQNSLRNLEKTNQEINQLTKEAIGELENRSQLQDQSQANNELGKITISELAAKAGVSRNAFYRNYKSKEEILETIYEKASQQVKETWHHLYDRLADSKTIENVSHWVKEKTKKQG